MTTYGNKILIPTLMVAFLTTGCSLGRTERGAIIGAGTGAIVGGAIGKVAGSTTRGAIIGAAVGGAAGALIASRMDDKADVLQRRLPNATVERVGEGILVTFDGGLLFGFDSDELRAEARARLSDLVSSLRDMPDVEVLVAGHTDSVGNDDYNYDLSLRRARSAADHLLAQGMSANRVSLTGLGETEPVATNDTEEGRAQNRRVEVAIYASEDMRAAARAQVGS